MQLEQNQKYIAWTTVSETTKRFLVKWDMFNVVRALNCLHIYRNRENCCNQYEITEGLFKKTSVQCFLSFKLPTSGQVSAQLSGTVTAQNCGPIYNKVKPTGSRTT